MNSIVNILSAIGGLVTHCADGVSYSPERIKPGDRERIALAWTRIT
jgi:UDP-N-acetyl-D-mannosaminuronate dehydrogenase